MNERAIRLRYAMSLTSGESGTAEEDRNAEIGFSALVPHGEEVADTREQRRLEETEDETSGNQAGELSRTKLLSVDASRNLVR